LENRGSSVKNMVVLPLRDKNAPSAYGLLSRKHHHSSGSATLKRRGSSMDSTSTTSPRGKQTEAIVKWEHIAVRVQAELGSRLRDFELLPSPDGLVLRGRTTTYYAKQLVQHAVMRLGRVRVLSNEIDVC
jgi:hypothetical protein